MADRFRQVAILGTGLIGSSLALALKSSSAPPRVSGFDLSGDHRRGAADLKTAAGTKAFDDVTGNLPRTLSGSDLVVLSAPVRALELLLREVAALATPGTVVTDTASTKQQVLAWAEAILPESLHFVGGNPMAGKVESGPWEAEAAIFNGATYCLCPLPRTSRDAVEQVVALVEGLGAVPYFVDAHEHDGLVAAVNHLPYLVSIGVMSSVASDRAWREAAALAAGGFATATHLTETDPQLFADICLTSPEAILRQLDRLSETLSRLREQVANGDESIRQTFAEAQQRHREWLSGRAAEGGAEAPAPIDTASMRPSNLFFPARLGELLRGRGKDRES
jgi:prephenate dehydrogenase